MHNPLFCFINLSVTAPGLCAVADTLELSYHILLSKLVCVLLVYMLITNSHLEYEFYVLAIHL